MQTATSMPRRIDTSTAQAAPADDVPTVVLEDIAPSDVLTSEEAMERIGKMLGPLEGFALEHTESLIWFDRKLSSNERRITGRLYLRPNLYANLEAQTFSAMVQCVALNIRQHRKGARNA